MHRSRDLLFALLTACTAVALPGCSDIGVIRDTADGSVAIDGGGTGTDAGGGAGTDAGGGAEMDAGGAGTDAGGGAGTDAGGGAGTDAGGGAEMDAGGAGTDAGGGAGTDAGGGAGTDAGGTMTDAGGGGVGDAGGAAPDASSCPTSTGNLIRNPDFSLPAPWPRPVRPEIPGGLVDSNDVSSSVGNPAPSGRLSPIGGTGGLRAAGHQCLLTPPSCLSRVSASIDVREDPVSSSRPDTTGYTCTIRVAGYPTADCTGAASAFIDLPTRADTTSVGAWQTITASGALPAAVQSSRSVDMQLFCVGPTAFLGNRILIDNPSLVVAP